MEFFVRAMEVHKNSDRLFTPEVSCADLAEAKAEAKRQVLAVSPRTMLLADACVRIHGRIVTKYRCCWNRSGEMNEYVFS